MLLSIFSLLISFFISNTVIADLDTDFKSHMQDWNDNSELATEHLKNAEKEFLNGDALQGCVEQRKAANYGISATESLIKAFEINGSTDDLSGVRSGLAKWKELRDFCG